MAFAHELSELDAASIKKVLLERDKNLYAIALQYREVGRRGTSFSAPGEYIRRAVAARSRDLFMRDNGHGHDELHWQDDPFRKTLVIGPDGWKVFSHVNRIVDDGHPFGGRFPARESVYALVGQELVFRLLCWWPYEEWTPPDLYGRSISMKKLFEDWRYALRADLEIVDGHNCVVMEIPGVDAFYLDSAVPSCTLRRDLWNTETASVASRFEYGEYKRYGADIWLPGRIRNVQFDANAHTATLRQRRVVDSTFVFSNILVNDEVDAGNFQLELPPGTVRNATVEESRERGGSYWEALRDGQADHLASLVEWVCRMQFYQAATAVRY
ncbi:MAG: hypothetical protein ACRD3W_15365, partial [Terriglobales bacterium]